MPRDKLVIILLTAFLLGVSALSVFVNLNLFWFLGWVILLLILVELLKEFSGKNLWWLILFLSLGMLRMGGDLWLMGQQNLSEFNGLEVELEGEIVAEPDVRAEKQYLLIEGERVTVKGELLEVRGLVKLTQPKWLEFEFGERVLISGLVEKPENGEDFAYADYLAKDGIYSIMGRGSVEVLENQEIDWGRWFGLQVINFRKYLAAKLEGTFNEPAASIVGGLLLGIRKTIPEEILDDFSTVGLTHILAISGFNITLIINIFALALSNLGKSKKIFLTIFGIVWFSLITGFSASVVRASLMGIILLIASFYERKAPALISLLLSAVIMVLANPRILNFDYSFQLSFLATLSLIWIMPIMEKKLEKWPALIKENLLVTLAAQVLTLPVIIDGFGSFSIISPLANLVVLPFIPWIMLTGFITLIVSILLPPLAVWLAGITVVLVEIKLNIVKFLAGVSWASVELAPISWWIWGIYLIFLFSFFGKSKLEQSSD
ncbi:MAG: ComEC/Rec2 family competence protein [Candidatus Altimarinota bacterium]